MNRAKSICIVITNDVYSDQRIQRSSTALTSAGFQVTVLYREKNLEQQALDFHSRGLSLWFNSGPLFYLEFNFRAFIFLVFNSFDIITAVDLDAIICCRMATWIKRRPLVFDVHEFFIRVPELINHPIKQWMWTAVERIFVKNISAAYTVNESLAAIFSDRYKIPFESIRNVPLLNNDYNQKHKSLPSSQPFILIYQGAINEGRGIEYYVEGLEYLPQCELWLVGKGDLSPKINKMVYDSVSKDRIKIKGFIAPQILPDVTAQAHIGLNMLNPESESYFHSLANRYYDYIKAGIPSIHMDFPEYRNAMNYHKTGVLVVDYSLDALIEAVNFILTDHKRYQKMSKNCIEAIRENNWQLEKTKLLAIYQSI